MKKKEYWDHARLMIGVLETEEDVKKALNRVLTLRSSGSMGTYLRAVRCVWWESHDESKKEDWADLEWAIRNNAPKRPRQGMNQKTVLTVELVDALKTVCDGSKAKSAISFLEATGARISEAMNVKMSDCRRTTRGVEVRYVSSKSKIPMTKEISNSLFDEIKEAYPGRLYLFETSGGKPTDRNYITRCVKKYGKKIGINISSHSFRHYYASMLLQSGKPISYVQKELGHKSAHGAACIYNHQPTEESA